MSRIVGIFEIFKTQELMFFKDITGQGAIKAKLINNIRNQRVSHAQLFLGPEGSGKLAMAIAYARYLACSDPSPEDACGTCSSCKKYNKLAHPDLSFFFPTVVKGKGEKISGSKEQAADFRSYLEKSPYVSLNGWYSHCQLENKQGIISAEDCNEIIRVLGYKSYESEYKVVIIWMIERLYHSAAPKLLKILEEPPEKTLFLIVSENQDQVLNTILSRTQMVRFPRLTDPEVVEGLTVQHQCTRQEAEQIAFLADGNYYYALEMLNSKENLEDNTGLLREWLRACYTPDMKKIVEFSEVLSKLGRERQKAFLGFSLEVFRQCTLLNYQANTLIKAHPAAQEFITRFSKVLTPAVAMQMSEEFSKAIYHVERNANPKILFTDLSLLSFRIMRAKQ